MIWNADLSMPIDGFQVLLGVIVGDDQTMVIAFRRKGIWHSTWDGSPLPNHWAPYCWSDPTPPDPALLDDEGY